MQTNTRITNYGTTHERKRNQRDYYMKQIGIMPPTESLYFARTLLLAVDVCLYVYIVGGVFFLSKTTCSNRVNQVKPFFNFNFWK